MYEMNFLISDSATEKVRLDYLARTTEETVSAFGGRCGVSPSKDRAVYFAEITDVSRKIFSTVLRDKIADVIAVNYKYRYFKDNIHTVGLDKTEYEYLISALISADLEEDKRYICSMLGDFETCSIDGFFNFRLKKLKEKWEEVSSYIPTYFSSEKLDEFISFIVTEKRGKLCYINDGKVFDGRYNRLRRGMLTDALLEGELVKEVILSGAGEVELNSVLSKTDERYLKRFFGDKIYFAVTR